MSLCEETSVCLQQTPKVHVVILQTQQSWQLIAPPNNGKIKINVEANVDVDTQSTWK